MMNKNKMGTGGLVDVKDPRDYQYEDIAKAGVPFDWGKGFDVEEEIGRKIDIKDQNGSSSCGGQAWGYFGQVLDPDHEEKSAKFIYTHTNAPGGGSTGRANCEFVIKKGWGSEPLTPSYKNGKPASEDFYLKNDVTIEAYNHALQDRAISYASFPFDFNIDTFAQAIRDEKGIILGVEGQNNGTWLSEFPKPPNGTSGIWRHWLYFGKAKMIKGKKYIGCINSWGKKAGKNGWQWIGEEYLPHIFSAWTLTYNTGELLIALLKRGSRGEQVKILQRKLNITVDGIFGKITDKAVREFQKSQGLLVDGIVGRNTRNALNNLAGNNNDMEKITKALTSRTVWTIIVIFAMNTMQLVSPFMSGDLQVLLNGILGLLATYFKINPSREY